MFMSDNKKKATSIIAKMNGMMDPKKEENGAEQDSSIGQDTAVEEILQAIKSENKVALKEALKSFIEMCDSEEDESEEEPKTEIEIK